MTMSKRLRIALLAGVVGVLGIEVGEWLSIPGMPSAVSPAHAIIGRPLTPMSVAGVARRTARRCAVGIYYC